MKTMLIILMLLSGCTSVPYGEIRRAVKAVEEAKEYCETHKCRPINADRVWRA